MSNKQILEKIYKNFQQKTGYGVVIGVEQEFYLGKNLESRKLESKDGNPLILDSSFLDSKLSAFPFFYGIEEEEGDGQFEVQISPTDDPVVMADMVMMLRELISKEVRSKKLEVRSEMASSQEMNTSHFPLPTSHFAAKPYPDQPGSGMHIHINLVDENGVNLFQRNGEEESVLLEQALAGLLELMPASIKYFAPYEDAYIRYIDHGMDSPSTVSWGPDNRTVALRIPSVPLTPYARRIEHRVSAADADPYLSIAAILLGVEFGIVNNLKNKHPKIFGNAFLPQYDLPKLPQNFEEAQAIKHKYLSDLI